MKFVRIFDGEVNVFAVKFKPNKPDEFEKVFDSWFDVEYLEGFFTEHKNDLEGGFYKIKSIA
jgi:hypothetical protein